MTIVMWSKNGAESDVDYHSHGHGLLLTFDRIRRIGTISLTEAQLSRQRYCLLLLLQKNVKKFTKTKPIHENS
jgi:hypothetical protein